ncbi:MAG TPA: cation:proton antiporter [Acidimicrobiia bacterium]|nr:cation:proton antiporter [Acidimicrobiia bacterium]
MDVNEILLDLLVVLLAAKVVAEVADRLRLPGVVGEITAGIVIGPSVLGLVDGGEVIETLAELGVILLLLEVGLEMDLAELRAVGRAALSVAGVGVVVPFALGYGAAIALGMDGNEALFVAAALTATSVGITARVFGDLRQLASVEARTVLGAAVADDVMGLVILTVVTRVVSEGSVSLVGVAGVIAVAVAFLVATTLIGSRVVPPISAWVARHARVAGSVLVLAVVLTLALAQLAHAADLAPIIGAFVAGLTLGQSSVAPRLRREIAPVAHVLVPVFFVQIGLHVDVAEFARLDVLGLAVVLLAVAVVGKLASAFGLGRAPGDRFVVGLGMLPRGEVGLIFAAIGLREGVFGDDVYAALLLVVLTTTMVAPPLLRARLVAVRTRREHASVRPVLAAGDDALAVVDGRVLLARSVTDDEALAVALDAARLVERSAPDDSVREYLTDFPARARRFDADARRAFVQLLEEGGPRSWRLLAMSNVLVRALPELADAIDRRESQSGGFDPFAALTWSRVARVRDLDALRSLRHPERVLLAALVLDACDDDDVDPTPVARRTAVRLGLGADAEDRIAALVDDRELLRAASRRSDAFGERPVLELAVHLGDREQADALYQLTLVDFDGEIWERERLDTLRELLVAVLERPELTGFSVAHAIDERRRDAIAAVDDPELRDRIRHAPRAYLLRCTRDDLVRHAHRCEPTPRRDEVRVFVDEIPGRGFRVEFVTVDELGLLARETRALADADLDVLDALAVVWGDGTALASYRVVGPTPPDVDELRAQVSALRRSAPVTAGLPDARLDFDDHGSPWHTRCSVRAPDVPGVLAAVTAAFAVAGANVHVAGVSHEGLDAVDVFELTERDGTKLTDATKQRIVRALADGVARRRMPVVGWR